MTVEVGHVIPHLARCGDPNGPGPVVVHVSHLVGQSLHVVRFEGR